jgi:hypothetical protein
VALDFSLLAVATLAGVATQPFLIIEGGIITSEVTFFAVP